MRITDFLDERGIIIEDVPPELATVERKVWYDKTGRRSVETKLRLVKAKEKTV